MRSREALRWRLIVLLFVLGGGLVWIAFRMEESGWRGLGPASLLELGFSLGLVGVIFVLERHFVKTVTTEARQLEERLDTRAGDLESRIDHLEAATSARRAQRYGRQEQAWTVLDEDASFASVIGALEQANELNALYDRRVDVQASDDLDGIRIEFAWGVEVVDDRVGPPHLTVRAENLPETSGGATPVVEVEWTPEMSAAEVGDAITLRLQRAGVYAGPGSFNWLTALLDLRRVLEIAIRGRRRAEGDFQLHGEVMTSRGPWIFTTGGIEHLDHGLVLAESKFPAPFGSPQVIQGPKPPFDPDCPTWAAEGEWERVVAIGRAIYPMRNLFLFGGAEWRPLRVSDTDRT